MLTKTVGEAFYCNNNNNDNDNNNWEARKVISENGGKHPLVSTALLYLPRQQDQDGRGLLSVETE